MVKLFDEALKDSIKTKKFNLIHNEISSLYRAIAFLIGDCGFSPASIPIITLEDKITELGELRRNILLGK